MNEDEQELRELKRLLKESPDNFEYHYRYAVFLTNWDADDKETAAKHFKIALKLEPQNGEIHFEYARFICHREDNDYLNAKDRTLAKEHYETALEIMPDNAEAHHEYSILLSSYNYTRDLVSGTIEAAYHEKRAIRHGLRAGSASKGYAKSLMKLGLFEEASREFSCLGDGHDYAFASALTAEGYPAKAIELYENMPASFGSTNHWFHVDYANTLVALSRHEEALEHYKRAFEIWETLKHSRSEELDVCPDLFLQFANGLCALGRVKEAEQLILKLMKREAILREIYSTSGEEPPSPRTIYVDYLLALGEKYKAALEYKKAIERSPAFAPYLIEFAKFLVKDMEQPEEAVLMLERVLKADPEDLDSFISCAEMLRELGQNEKAIKYCEEVLEICSEHEAAHHILVELHGERGDSAKALKHLAKEVNCRERRLEKTLELEPQSERLLRTYAQHQLQECKAYKAAVYYEEALNGADSAKKPFYYMLHSDYARLLREMGDHEKAAEHRRRFETEDALYFKPKGQRDSEKMESLTKTAEQGDADAQYELGLRYSLDLKGSHYGG